MSSGYGSVNSSVNRYVSGTVLSLTNGGIRLKTRSQYRDWLHRQMVRMEPLDDTPKPAETECEKVARVAGKLGARHGLGGAVVRRATTSEEVLRLLADCLRLLNEAPEPEQDTLTVREAAQRLGCSERSLYDLVRHGRIGHYRVGRSIRFRPDDLADYQQDSRVRPTFRHLT
jgi:excisionase family DNA binding protein